MQLVIPILLAYREEAEVWLRLGEEAFTVLVSVVLALWMFIRMQDSGWPQTNDVDSPGTSISTSTLHGSATLQSLRIVA